MVQSNTDALLRLPHEFNGLFESVFPLQQEALIEKALIV